MEDNNQSTTSSSHSSNHNFSIDYKLFSGNAISIF